MKFSTKSTYGLRAMICLGQANEQVPISLSFISEKENISLKYLERIFANLKKSSLVSAVKGSGGGYRLIKKPEDISIKEIITSLEGELNVFHCIDDKGKVYCQSNCNCQANNALQKIQNEINSSLNKIKLSELL